MAETTITLELPEELAALLGPPELLQASVREALVLALLRDARLSQSKAARLLGITRWDILDLMALHCIPSGPETAEEAERDVAAAVASTLKLRSSAGC